MSDLIRELEVLALDCQASGATPAYGDLLELGWAVCSEAGISGPVRSRWIVPRTERRIARAVRELTGWTEACIAEALDERQAWVALGEDVGRLAGSSAGAPTVIHFARFELAFLRDLQQRLDEGGGFPFDAVCLHAIAARLFPDLPRRNIRALAGYLGHSPELMRRSAGHVEATAFIWRALVPLLEQAGLHTWEELKAWLAERVPAPRRKKRTYPLALERRRGLPDAPGVYRFLRRNGDVLYVGKATSLRKRVASHFKSRGFTTERALEFLSQVHDVAPTQTASLLEAALLERDEIQRLDPPYNVQLRSGDRNAWFAARDFRTAGFIADDVYRIGPLPSEWALFALSALICLAEGADASPGVRAAALGVSERELPDEALFTEGLRTFVAEHLDGHEPSASRRVQNAARALWLERGRVEVDVGDDATPDLWDLARVRRRLERNLIQTGLLVRRSRWLCLLANANVAFRERNMKTARGLVVSKGELVEWRDLDSVTAIATLPTSRPRLPRERRCSFDRAAYDRLRILLTELHRIHDAGGEIVLRVGGHTLVGERLGRLLRDV